MEDLGPSMDFDMFRDVLIFRTSFGHKSVSAPGFAPGWAGTPKTSSISRAAVPVRPPPAGGRCRESFAVIDDKAENDADDVVPGMRDDRFPGFALPQKHQSI